MKKSIVLIIAAVTMTCTSSFAQLSIGIKGGLNVASVSNLTSSSTTAGSVSSSNKTSPKLGMHLGGYIHYSFSDLLGFQPEVLFSMKGYKHESTVTIGSSSSKSEVSATINYIEIPVQLRINPNEQLHILAGPYIGILAGASSTSKFTSGSISTESTSKSTNGLNSMDIGMSLGLGFKADSGFAGGLKYSRGFNSIDENDNNESNVNSVFQFFIGFEFGGR